MKKEPLHTKYQAGFSLVEVILASSVFILIATALAGAYLYGQESTALAGDRARAVLLAEEGLEAVRNIRDEDFTNLTSGTHGLAISGNQWILSGSSDTTGIFTRTISISDIDADRKSVSSTISWQQNAQRLGSVTAITQLSDWQETAEASSCDAYAVEEGYDAGTCRSNSNKCGQNNEDYLPDGDQFCLGTGGQNVCCVSPGG